MSVTSNFVVAVRRRYGREIYVPVEAIGADDARDKALAKERGIWVDNPITGTTVYTQEQYRQLGMRKINL